MKLPDDSAKIIMEAAEIFQRKLTRMAAKSAADNWRAYISEMDIEFALALLLRKDGTADWKKS